jgi:signal transduction histidine kinase
MPRPAIPMPPARDVVGASERSEVRSAIERFLLMGFAALLIVAIPVAFWIRAQAESHALENAQLTTQRLADYAVAPLVTPELLAAEPVALRALRDRLNPWLADGSIVRIKVWDADGRIIYSDVPSLIGEAFEFEGWARALLAGGPGTATIERQDQLENAYETDSGELVEVYVRSQTAAGDPLIFEAYFDDARVRQEQADLLVGMAPLFLLSLAVLQLAQLVPAVRLAHRIQAHQAVRRLLLQRAVDASDLERQRIARDLHDEVIQDLAGLSYALEAEERHGGIEDRPLLARANSILQKNVRALRTITSDLYPPDLARLGLPTALARLADPLHEQGIDVDIQLPMTFELDRGQTAVLYRVAREALSNSTKHAQARTVELSLVQDAECTVMRVVDDGCGFDTKAGAPAGHLGMQLMKDTVHDAGGSLDVISTEGAGTSITATLGRRRRLVA